MPTRAGVTIEVKEDGSAVILDMEEKLKDLFETGTEGSKKMRKKTEELKTSTVAMGTAIGHAAVEVGKFALRAGKALFSSMTESVKMASEFETQLTAVYTLLGDQSPEQAFQMSQKEIQSTILDMSGGLGKATEMVDGLYNAISAGIPAENALSFTATASKLAAAGMTNAASAIDILTTATASFSHQGLDAAKASDILFKSVEKGKLTMTDLASRLGNVIPAGQAAKATFEEINAATATLSVTQGAAIGMTNLKAAFTALVAEGEKFKKAGIDISKTMDEEGLTGVLSKLRDRFGDNTAELNKFMGSVEARSAIIPLITTQFEKFKETLEAMENAEGSTEAAFLKMSQTFGFQIKEVQGKIDSLRIKFGTLIKDALEPILPHVNSFLERMNEFADANYEDHVSMVSEAVLFLLKVVKEGIKGIQGLKVTVSFFKMIGTQVELSLMVASKAVAQFVTDVTGYMQKAIDGLIQPVLALASAFSFDPITKKMISHLQESHEKASGILGSIGEVTGDIAAGADGVITDLQKSLADSRSEYDRQLDTYNELDRSLTKMIADIEASGGASTEQAKSIKKVREELEKLNEEAKKDGSGSGTTGSGASKEVLKGADAMLKKLGASGKDVKQTAHTLILAFNELEKIVGKGKAWNLLQKQITDTQKKIKDFSHDLGSIKGDWKEVLDKGAEEVAQHDFVMQLSGEMNEARTFKEIDESVDKITEQLPEVELAVDLDPGNTIEVDKVNDKVKKIKESVYSVEDAWKDVGRTVVDMMSQWAQGAIGFGGAIKGILGAVGGSISNLLGSEIGKSVGGMLSNVGGMLGKLGGPLGSIVGQVAGGFIGAGITKLGKLFGGKPEYKKQMERLGRDMGVSIDEGLAKQLAESKKTLGSSAKAFVAHFSDILGQAKLDDAGSFQQFIAGTATEFKNAAASAEEYEGALSDLIPKAMELGQVGTEGFRQMVEQARAAGADVDKLLKEHIGPSLEKAVSGISKLWTTFGKVGEKKLGNFANLSSFVFNQLLDNGYSFTEAMEVMGDQIDEIGDRYRELGASGNAAFEELLQFREIAEENKNLFERATALNEIFEGLGEAGALTKESFKDLQGTVVGTFNRMVEAGLTEEQTIRQMLPTLREIKNAHDMGMPIGRTTKAILDQATELGFLKGSGDKVVDAMNLLTVTVADAFGVKIPNAIRKSVDELWNMNNAAQQVGNTVSGAGGTGGRSNTGGKRKPLPRFAREGIYEHDTPGGAGLAMVDDREHIISEQRYRSLTSGAGKAPNVNINIPLEVVSVDGETLASHTIQITQKALDERRITVRADAIKEAG